MIKETKFEKEWYDECVKQGLDYSISGQWQKAYAKMVISITEIIEPASNNRNSIMIDLGSACGATLKAFKDTKVFKNCIGFDISNYMTNIGKTTLGFDDDELIQFDVTENPLPFDDNSVLLINCTHLLEYIKEEFLDFIISEIHRVLEPENGYAFIIVPAIKPGYSKDIIKSPNKNIQTMNWWRSKFSNYFTIIDNEVRKRFKESTHSPTGEKNEKKEILNFYHYYNKDWTLFGLKK